MRIKFIFTAVLSLFAAFPLAAEEVFTLDGALNNGMDYLAMQVPADKTVLLFNIECANTDISDYIINELTSAIVNGAYFTLVDRKNMAALETELNFQLSGMVSDETSISVGRMTGVGVIISGSFTNMGKSYKLYIQVSDVETSQILASKTYMVKKDKKLSSLLKSARLKPPKDKKTSSLLKSVRLKLPKADKPLRFPRPDELYLGARIGLAQYDYRLNTNTGVGHSGGLGHSGDEFHLDAALQMLVCFTDNFALQTELVFLQDKVELGIQNLSVTANASSLMIPIFARLYTTEDISSTEVSVEVSAGLFGGVYFNAPLGQMMVTRNGASKSYNYTNPLGIAVGADLGFKLGQGILFGELRLGGDTDFVNADGASQFQRALFSFSAGYRIGLINR